MQTAACERCLSRRHVETGAQVLLLRRNEGDHNLRTADAIISKGLELGDSHAIQFSSRVTGIQKVNRGSVAAMRSE
jgi:hypothetical protein